MAKILFYDYSKEGVEYNKFNLNEIFIEIDSKYIKANDNIFNEEEKKEGLSLEENDEQVMFKNIYVFNSLDSRKEK